MNLQFFKQVFKYVAVGLVALAVDVASFTLIRYWGADLIVANTGARFMGAVTAYSGNHLWTFSQSKQATHWLRTSWRYVLVWVLATMLSTFLLNTLVNFGLQETLSKLGVEMMMPMLNFLVSRYWVFQHKATEEEA